MFAQTIPRAADCKGQERFTQALRPKETSAWGGESSCVPIHRGSVPHRRTPTCCCPLASTSSSKANKAQHMNVAGNAELQTTTQHKASSPALGRESDVFNSPPQAADKCPPMLPAFLENLYCCWKERWKSLSALPFQNAAGEPTDGSISAGPWCIILYKWESPLLFSMYREKRFGPCQRPACRLTQPPLFPSSPDS